MMTKQAIFVRNNLNKNYHSNSIASSSKHNMMHVYVSECKPRI